MRYPEIPDKLITLEEETLARWRDEDLFRQTLKATESGEPFVFFEGPPTANGRPGLHHIISRTIKDLVCRFRTMEGRSVTRIAGWDTHGLPVEIEAEKRLGISGKPEIEALGIAEFNAACRDSVFTYKKDWEALSERIGYWLDYTQTVCHPRSRLRGKCMVDSQATRGPGSPVPRVQEPPILSTVRDRAQFP